MANNPEVSRVRVERQRHDSVGGEEHVMGGHVEGVLFGLGNPLLDIMAVVTDEFLHKYALKRNDATVASDKHKPLFDDMIEKFHVEYVPGGATLNSLRIAQWLIGVPKATTYVGCINKDKFGQILESKVKAEGVQCCFQYDESEPTGSCAVCLTGSNRSLVANLGAAQHISIRHLQAPENRTLMEKARYFYMSSFPLTVCLDCVLDVAKYAVENDCLFVFNLSAPFLCKEFCKEMVQVLPYVDILFGNRAEKRAFAEALNFGTTDLKEISIRLARWPKQNGKRGRMVICTRTADPTLVIRDGIITEHPVIPIDAKDIVDTNGAGDAFVGGFLAQLVQGGSVDDCIRSANYAANYIIQRSGCQLPDKPNFSRDSVGF